MASPRASNAVLPDHRREQEAGGGPAISLASVTRVFGATPAVVRVDLTVERGESVLIRGPNGAGKTTLLRIVAAAISPTYGTGEVLGFDLSREREHIRRLTELLTHRTRLYEDLTGEENLRFTCTIHGLDPAGVREALDRVGLAEAASQRVRGYSQGMRQRVALARAVLRRPPLLLLDEPYAGLDSEARGVVDELVATCTEAGGTAVLATHDPGRAAMPGRTIFMDRGRVLPELGRDPAGERKP